MQINYRAGLVVLFFFTWWLLAGGIQTASAQLSPENPCKRYAQEAVRQNQQNFELQAGFKPPVWSSDFKGHYNWCMQGGNVGTTPGHLAARAKQLQEFAINKLGKDGAAKRYAKESVRQFNQSSSMAAGFKPPVWSGDFNGHYNWSRHGENIGSTPGHLAAREKSLQEYAVSHNKGPAATAGGSMKVVKPSDTVVTPLPKAILIPGILADGSKSDKSHISEEITIAQHEYTYGKLLIPLIAYYSERYNRNLLTNEGMEKAVNTIMSSSPEALEFYSKIAKNYAALPLEKRLKIYDAEVVKATADPNKVISLPDLKKPYLASLKSSISPRLLVKIQQGTEIPQAPEILVAENRAAGNIDNPTPHVALSWQWSADKAPAGWAIYRKRSTEPDFSLLTTVQTGSKISFSDKNLPVPSLKEENLCYQVKAYNIPFVSSTYGNNRIESDGSNIACTPFHKDAKPQDFDGDGIPDSMDLCPTEPGAISLPRVYGCLDGDGDGFPDYPQISRSKEPGKYSFISRQWTPDTVYEDNCPPGINLDVHDGYQNRPAEWAHLRPIDQIPGCPVQYSLRFMGIEILNDPADCTDPNVPDRSLNCDKQYIGLGNEYGQKNEKINGQLPPGFEPYLTFSIVNGTAESGLLQEWTKKWCCGEGVKVNRYAISNLPFAPPNKSGIEPDEDFSGAEDIELDRAISQNGQILFPMTSQFSHIQYRPIDRFGMTMIATLFERDFDMQYTPSKYADEIDKVVGTIPGLVVNLDACINGGKNCGDALSTGINLVKGGLISAIGTATKDLIANLFFPGNDDPPDVTVKDRDDIYGVINTSFLPFEAGTHTDANGVYGFALNYPPYIAGHGSSYGRDFHTITSPLYTPKTTVANMVGKVNFCLVRRGVDESKVRQLCQPFKDRFFDKKY